MNFNDLLTLGSGTSGVAIAGIIYHLRVWRREARELAFFRAAYDKTEDPKVLETYAAMRTGRVWWPWRSGISPPGPPRE